MLRGRNNIRSADERPENNRRLLLFFSTFSFLFFFVSSNHSDEEAIVLPSTLERGSRIETFFAGGTYHVRHVVALTFAGNGIGASWNCIIIYLFIPLHVPYSYIILCAPPN